MKSKHLSTVYKAPHYMGSAYFSNLFSHTPLLCSWPRWLPFCSANMFHFFLSGLSSCWSLWMLLSQFFPWLSWNYCCLGSKSILLCSAPWCWGWGSVSHSLVLPMDSILWSAARGHQRESESQKERRWDPLLFACCLCQHCNFIYFSNCSWLSIFWHSQSQALQGPSIFSLGSDNLDLF